MLWKLDLFPSCDEKVGSTYSVNITSSFEGWEREAHKMAI
jgi:hypothetical protein